MAPKYKLTYFDLKGRGEAIRFLLSYMGEDFEDVRVTFAQWSTVKPTTPYGKLPVLEEDGIVMTQSIAICRYLGNKAGLAGKDVWENAQIDIIAYTVEDLLIQYAGFFWEQNADLKKTKKETFMKETYPFYFQRLDAIAKENNGYLANNKLSWADFVFVTLSEYMNFGCEREMTSGYPHLHALREKVFSLPQIKKWLLKRPQAPN